MNIFYNSNENRYRAGWRILLQLALMISIGIVLLIITGVLNIQDIPYNKEMILLVSSVLSVWIAVRTLDKRPFDTIGISLDRSWFSHFVTGTVIAAVAMSLVFLMQFLLGWTDFTGYGWERAWQVPYILPFLGYLVIMILVGFYEELVFRGYQILNMTEGLTGPGLSPRYAALSAVFISSAMFGIGHSWNPNASLISGFNIFIAGIVLAYPYLVTGNLGISVGIHFAWNFFQGGVFGFPVSGTINRSSLLQINETGPDFITGGAFGPEAGLSGIMGLSVVFLLVYFYLKRKGFATSLHHRFRKYHSK